MEKVIILTEQEYEEFLNNTEVLFKRMEELEEIIEDKDKLQEYIREWLQ